MRSADECLAKAAELSRLAELSNMPSVGATLLTMAETWLDLARLAELKDVGSSVDGMERLRRW